MQNVYETELAWELLETAKPHLSVGERNLVFATVGAGDTFPAIRHLLKIIGAKHIAMRSDLVRRCSTWVDTYASHEDQESIRRLMDGILMRRTIQGSTLRRAANS